MSIKFNPEPLRDARIRKGLTRRRAALLMEISPNTVTRMEAKGIATETMVAKYAEAMGLTVDDLDPQPVEAV